MHQDTKRFEEISSLFKALQCDDSPALWQGMILGACARRPQIEERKVKLLCAQILNDGEPLPSRLNALVEEMIIDARAGFAHHELTLLLPAAPAQARLQALSALCYGLMHGLSLDPDQKSDHSPAKISDPNLLDFLNTLLELQRVDEQDELDEESFATVLTYLEETLCAVQDSFS